MLLQITTIIKKACQFRQRPANTDEPYVIIYAHDGFKIILGAAVERENAADSKDAIPIDTFFRDFFNCKTGDKKVVTAKKKDFYTAASELFTIRAKQTVVVDANEAD